MPAFVLLPDLELVEAVLRKCEDYRALPLSRELKSIASISVVPNVYRYQPRSLQVTPIGFDMRLVNLMNSNSYGFSRPSAQWVGKVAASTHGQDLSRSLEALARNASRGVASNLGMSVHAGGYSRFPL